MLDDFLVRAYLGGIGVALLAAPLGCFVVWQRMSYFGETVAHSGLLGASLGLIFGVNITYGMIAIAVLTALLLGVIERSSFLARDTILGLLAHVMLALGLILSMSLGTKAFNLEGLLFGDMLAVSKADLAMILASILGLGFFFWRYWSAMVSLSVNEELAAAEGVNVARTKSLFTLMIALVVALSMKLVGLLLVTSLLIMPAAASRSIAKSPIAMALWAVFFGLLSVLMGMSLADYFYQMPGPVIVLILAFFFVICQGIGWLKRSV